MPKVSVIIPNYNHAKFLKQRIDSVLNQTFQDFEVIILDDCSTDESRTVIESYRDHQKISHIIYNDINSGSPFKQWQKGIQLSEGEYIWIAESDDWANNLFLEKTIACFKKNISVGIISVNFEYIDENGFSLKTDYFYDKFDKVVNGNQFVTKEMLLYNKLYNASGVIFKKSYCLDIIDNKLTKMKYCGDWFFWNQVILRTDIVILSCKLNYFRRHTNNVSFKSEKLGLFYKEGLKTFEITTELLQISTTEKKSLLKIWAYKLATSNFIFFRGLQFCLSLTNPFNLLLYYMYYKLKFIK